MIHIARRLAGPRLRALFLASLIGLVAGGAVLVATEARAQQGAPFVSDRLSVEVLGAGPDVILIPGYASSREVWRTEAVRLATSHRVHMVQLAGFAGEPWSQGDAPVLQPAVAELARYIRQADLERPAVIGHSMGGLSALLLAQQNPGLVARVMSVDSLPFYAAMFSPQATVQTTEPFAERAARMILTADEAAFRNSQVQSASALARDAGIQAAMVEWSMAGDRQAMATAIREVMLTDVRPLLPSLTIPVWAVYASDSDGGAPAAVADAVWAREWAGLEGVTLRRIDGSRHFIMADQPGAFAEVVDSFLED